MRIRPHDLFPGQPECRKNTDYPHVMRNPRHLAEFVKGKIKGKIDWYGDYIRNHGDHLGGTWQERVIEILYKGNLRIDPTTDGKVVCDTGDSLIIKWESPCPILTQCQAMEWSTCEVCSTLYHAQYQALLSQIEPRAFFARDYSRLRPKGDECIEAIVRIPEDDAIASKGDT